MLKDIQPTGKKDTRSGFGDGIVEAARKNKNIVALTADLAGSLKLQQFIKEFPERFIQVGIAEANMIGIAAGLTIGGKIPFTTTFANFSTGRVYDQIRQSVAYSGKNVKICASHAGVTLGEDGATHQILEDIGMMKMLPGMTVIVPCDYNQTKAATIAVSAVTAQRVLRMELRMASSSSGFTVCRLITSTLIPFSSRATPACMAFHTRCPQANMLTSVPSENFWALPIMKGSSGLVNIGQLGRPKRR